MRNVNINSIRYYEKQKILLPAWIDPETKYRYYQPEQLNILDAILLCIRLGIHLKELKQYVDKDGRLNEKRIAAASYSCFQADLTHDSDIVKLLNEKVNMQEAKTVIVTNMLLDKLHYSSRHSEIQISANSLGLIETTKTRKYMPNPIICTDIKSFSIPVFCITFLSIKEGGVSMGYTAL